MDPVDCCTKPLSCSNISNYHGSHTFNFDLTATRVCSSPRWKTNTVPLNPITGIIGKPFCDKMN